MENDAHQQRLHDVQRFYGILDRLEIAVTGKQTLGTCNGRMGWPNGGVYFFFEPGEYRSTSGSGARVVRVGTHGLVMGGKQTFWKRLSNHQGSMKSGGGNHRGSVFRLHVGSALINKGGWPDDIAKSWEGDRKGNPDIRRLDEPLEKAVSVHIRSMPFLWLAINDQYGPDSLRGLIEWNCIALLSNYNFPDSRIDPPGENWLGHWSQREVIRRSGLWNVNYIRERYNPSFLDIFEDLVTRQN